MFVIFNNISWLDELIKVLPNICIIGLCFYLYNNHKNNIHNIINSLDEKFYNSKLKEITIGYITLAFEKAGSDYKNDNVKIPNVTLSYSEKQRINFILENKVKIRTLWIDDEEIKTIGRRYLLTKLGMTIDYVESSDKAIKNLKTNNYDLIISDFERNNDKDAGIEFINRIVEKEGINIPVIFCTGEYKDENGYPKQIPQHAFGVACGVDDLLLLCLDILERNIKDPNETTKCKTEN